MTHLIDFIDHWQPRRILVVGDYMLDQYLYGNAERLSPDAPVPVLAVEREEHAPGGASNVCMYLRALKCDVWCVGVTGRDAAAQQLRSRLEEAGCDTAALIEADDNRPTTVKRSYVGLAQHRHPQKMFRADHESKLPVPPATIERLIAAAESLLDGCDVVCIEDYDKGVVTAPLCRAVIEAARRRGVPVLIDPAAIDDYAKYAGATAITPNRTEAQRATGLPADTDEQIRKIAAKLLDDLMLDAVVLTLDRHGALLLERGGEPIAAPTVARSVYDVTGAGDMVLAMLAGAISNAAAWHDAVKLANVAAGLEVERFGVVPVALEEVLLSLLQQSRAELGKVRTLDQLLPELSAYRRQGRRIAFTNGCFDILHAGHVELLRGARNTADLLVLAVNTDASIRRLKGEQRPINNEADRVNLLTELESIDYIILFGDGEGGEGDTPIPLLRAIRPDVLVKGGDYEKQQVVGWQIVEAYGGQVVTIPPVKGRSTTHIVQRIRSSG